MRKSTHNGGLRAQKRQIAPRQGTPQKEEKPRRVRIGRLETPRDVARYCARLIRRAEGTGGGAEAYKLTCMAAVLLRAIEAATSEEMEERLKRLEELVARMPKVEPHTELSV